MAAANVSSMFKFWKDFKLSEFQKELDTLASELANRQDESDTSRKRLVEQSREFKKNTPEDVRRAVAGLLKSFQSEVDNLSKRSKAAEGSFLTVYKKLIDVPDPSSCLEYGMTQQKRAQKAQDLEIENQKLRETLAEYNQEFAEVKNQEVTIKNLQSKLKELEDKLELEAQTKAAEKEKDLQKEFLEKERVLQEKQLSAATKLGEAEQKNQNLQKALESLQSELFDHKAKHEERSAAKSDEVDMLVTDLERANQRTAAVEKELEGLRSQLQSTSQSLQQAEQMQKAPNLEQAIDILSRSSLELELSAKEKEISQLVEEVQKLQTSNNKLRETMEEKTHGLEEQLQVKTRAFQKLEEKIQSQGDYEDLKRELSILKSMEFSNGADSSDAGEGEEEGGGPGKSLEMLLLEKNRALQTENTTLKVSKSDLNGATSTTPDNGIRQAQAFASMIGQEVAAAYSQRQNSASSSDDPQPQQKSQIIQPIIVIPPSHGNLPPNPPMFAFANGVGGGVVPGYGPAAQMFPGAANSMFVNRQLLESYHWIDTTRVAKQIKDLLTQLNIGQRLFGELVLGMSQGSVSDILARPKPWDRLTAKGREPYIKMVQFLADPRNVEQLKILNAQRKGVDVDALSQTSPTPSQSSKSSSDAVINNILAKARQELDMQREMMARGTKRSSPASGGNEESGNKRKRKKSQVNRIIPSLWNSEHSPKGNPPPGLKREPLSPLSSSDYAENADLDTFHIIRRCKEVLEQSNIPQEPFGTYVVGMSQGSVSDLLSKAKPWGSLTLKGKEPFVRMSKWLKDPDGIAKLKERTRQDKLAQSVVTVLDMPPAGEEEVSTSSQPEPAECSPPTHSTTQSPGGGDQDELPPELPPVHEQAAMIEYLDTYELTRQVKCVLHENNLGQRAFGEAVLGLTQGSVSDLLSKPKMWLKLSMKGREPYVRMYLWLHDKGSIDKVKNYKPVRKAKRVMTLTPHGMSTPIRIIPPKRPRMILSPEEKAALHAAYNADAYPPPAAMDKIAKDLNLPESTVINWFHNHRSRLKRQPIYPPAGKEPEATPPPVYLVPGAGADQPQVITLRNEGPLSGKGASSAVENGANSGGSSDAENTGEDSAAVDAMNAENSRALDALREAVDLAARNAELQTACGKGVPENGEMMPVNLTLRNVPLQTAHGGEGIAENGQLMAVDLAVRNVQLRSAASEKGIPENGELIDDEDGVDEGSRQRNEQRNNDIDAPLRTGGRGKHKPLTALEGAMGPVICSEDREEEDEDPYVDIIKLRSGTEEYD